MKRAIKTISLTIDELTQLLAIDDSNTRRSIAEAVRTEAVDGSASIESQSEPMIECLVEKIRKKRRAAERRRQTREHRKLEADQCGSRDDNDRKDIAREKSVMFESGMSLLDLVKNDSPQVLPIDSFAVTKILNVVYHHKSWFDNFFNLFDRLPENSAIGQMVRQTKDSIKHLASYLPKLKVLAQNYYTVPLLDRPSEVLL